MTKNENARGVRLDFVEVPPDTSRERDPEWVRAHAREFCGWSPEIIVEQFGAVDHSDSAAIEAVISYFADDLRTVAEEGCRQGLSDRKQGRVEN